MGSGVSPAILLVSLGDGVKWLSQSTPLPVEDQQCNGQYVGDPHKIS